MKEWDLIEKKKIRVLFLGTILKLKDEVTSSFINLLGKSLWYDFFLNSFCSFFSRVMDSYLKHWDIYISFQGGGTYEDLIIVFSLYWNGRNFLHGFLAPFGGFFHIIFGVIFIFLFWMFLDYHSWFLLGCYYYWDVIIIVEESFSLDKWIL